MVILNLTLSSVGEPGTGTDSVELSLHRGYGADPALAHALLQVALTAEVPLVMDSDGELFAIEPGTILAFSTRLTPDPA